MKKEYYFIAALVLFAVVLFGFGSRAGLALQAALRGPTPVPSAGPVAPPVGAANLTASVGNTAGNAAGLSGNVAGLKVRVYSQYPLNLKNQLSVAAGNADGIAVGDIALVNGYLVGIVEKTFERSALVQTIFDKRFQTPVRIGAAGADALLRGGNDPELTLIPTDAAVGEGDGVYAAANGMPYGAPIGSLRNLRDSGDKVFREATLSVPYNSAGLEELSIIPSSKR